MDEHLAEEASIEAEKKRAMDAKREAMEEAPRKFLDEHHGVEESSLNQDDM